MPGRRIEMTTHDFEVWAMDTADGYYRKGHQGICYTADCWTHVASFRFLLDALDYIQIINGRGVWAILRSFNASITLISTYGGGNDGR